MQKRSQKLYEQVFSGTFGLERETLRITPDGYLSQTPHPFPGQATIDRDFCESQVEIITPVCHSIEELCANIESIDRTVREGLLQLDPPEYLWPFSNPPYIVDETAIPIAQFEGELEEKTVYRNYLAKKYGKRKMLFCGIHFNYAYANDFLQSAMEAERATDFRLFQDQMYLRLSQKIELTSWLPVFLTAASPIFDGSFLDPSMKDEDCFIGYASIRSGESGYWNDFVPIIDYTDMERYTDSIQNYVDSGQLQSPSEWYTPVRIKPRGQNSLSDLRNTGANHIELRMLDVNPFSHLGIFREDLEFLHLYLIFLTFQPLEDFGEAEQIAAVHDHKCASLYRTETVTVHLHGKELPLEEATDQFLTEMDQFFSSIGREDVLPVLSKVRERCKQPENRYANRVYRLFHIHYALFGRELAKRYAQPDAMDWIENETIAFEE